jgi:transposase InsO family protein
MPWKATNVSEQRFQFVLQASRRERTLIELCREFGISRQTGYLWWKRFQQDGLAGVQEHSRRPHHSPDKVAAAVVNAVVELRRYRPDWGAQKLHRLLRDRHADLPTISISTLHRILNREGLLEDGDRHRRALERFERSRPNELWQMDFKGPQGFNRGIGPLSILDDHSRYVVLLKQVGSTQLKAVRGAMQEAFAHAGLPETLLIDHGTPWWNGASSTGWTELTVWILRQGIRIAFSGFRHPQTQGKVERMHGVLQRASRKRQRNFEDQHWLDEFRHEYNHLRPHQALGMQTPASRWQPSARRFQPDPLDWNYAADIEPCRLSNQGQLRWAGQRWEISRALRHQLVGVQRVHNRVLVYFCNAVVRELNLGAGRSLPTRLASTRSIQR